MRLFLRLACGFSALVASLGFTFGACSSEQQRGNAAGSGPGGGGSAGAGGQGNTGGSILPPSDSGIVPILDGGLEGATCAADAYRAELVPLDLMLLVDGSSSMLSMVNGKTKWQQVSDAMKMFVGDPKSAGLGVGLQFFPQPGTGSVCQTDRDCGFVNPPTPPPCQPTQFCMMGSTPMNGLRSCGVREPACPQGSPCVPGGRCAVSALDCTNIGQACSNAAGDTCAALPKTCDQADTESCDPALYQMPAVPFTTAPAPASRLVSLALEARGPGGGTPLGPAVKGALAYVDGYLASHPGHRGALVLATDGEPAGCTPADIPSIGALLSAARTGPRPVTTYVIGIFAPGQDASPGAFDQLATAGGTAPPFLIRPMENLAERFFEVLASIRGQALPCSFAIPILDAGALDPFRVNVRFQGSQGNELVLFVRTRDRCDPVRGGWYYDVDPAVGKPTRVIACDATCAHWKSEPNGKVELLYGCATEIVR